MTPTTSEREAREILSREYQKAHAADPRINFCAPEFEVAVRAVMAARPQVELPELRGAFHAFVKSQGGSVVQREGEYIESMTRLWWTCWKAAIAESEARAEGWKEFAQHQSWCADCAESVDSCPIGRELRAIAQEAERG